MREREINLKVLARDLKKGFLWIVAVTVLMAVICGLGAGHLLQKGYTSSVSFLIYNNEENTGKANSIYMDRDTVMNTLVYNCVELAKSKGLVEEMISENGLTDLSADTFIDSNLKVEKKEKGSIFTVEIKTGDSELSYLLAGWYAQKMPELFSGISEEYAIKVIGQPVRGPIDSSLGVKAGILGAILGFLLAVVAIIVKSLLSSKVKTVEDVETCTDIPVIADFSGIRKDKGEKQIEDKIGFLDNVVEWKLKDIESPCLLFTGVDNDVSELTYRLGRSLVQSGNKVLVADLNSKTPALTGRMSMTDAAGLAEILTGSESVESVTRSGAKEEGLFDFIPLGRQEFQSVDAKAFQVNFLDQCKDYDYILINACSINQSPATAKIAEAAYTLIGITLEKSTIPELEALLKHVDHIKDHILGIVLN